MPLSSVCVCCANRKCCNRTMHHSFKQPKNNAKVKYSLQIQPYQTDQTFHSTLLRFTVHEMQHWFTYMLLALWVEDIRRGTCGPTTATAVVAALVDLPFKLCIAYLVPCTVCQTWRHNSDGYMTTFRILVLLYGYAESSFKHNTTSWQGKHTIRSDTWWKHNISL